MPQNGSLPTTSIWGTWVENVAFYDNEDGSLVDLSSATEIRLRLRSLYTGLDELSLTMSNGDIEVVAFGVIEWRVSQTTMGTLNPNLYEAIVILESEDEVVPYILGTISIVE